jgi:hypothetical protein
MSENRPKRPFGIKAYLLVMAVTVVIGAFSGAASAILETVFGVSGFWVNAPLLLIAMGAAMALCVWWWRGIDEAAREAHKWAWWWGGTGGMAVGAALVLSLQLGGAPINTTDMSAGDLIAAGMMSILLFQVVGYSIAWAAWWLRHR